MGCAMNNYIFALHFIDMSFLMKMIVYQGPKWQLLSLMSSSVVTCNYCNMHEDNSYGV